MAHILIADDDDLVAQVACNVLIDAGHACGWVESAEAAWSLIEKKRPDILLLDQDLPGMSGVSLLRRLRGSERFYDLPVVMFTAMNGKEDESRAIYAGAQDYVRKPFTSLTLTRAIDWLLARGGNQHLNLRERIARDAGIATMQYHRERRVV